MSLTGNCNSKYLEEPQEKYIFAFGMQETLIIGLTGGIGSGKSFISRGLESMGYEVYNSDAAAQRLIHDNPCVRSQIELLFGSDIFVEDHYDKHRVASMVFSDPELLGKLNQIVHPAVAYDLHEWAGNAKGDIVFAESAILFESGFNKLCRAVVCISAPDEMRVARIMARDNTSREAVEQRMHNQAEQEWIKEQSDLVIENDGSATVEALCEQIRAFAERLKE